MSTKNAFSAAVSPSGSVTPASPAQSSGRGGGGGGEQGTNNAQGTVVLDAETPNDLRMLIFACFHRLRIDSFTYATPKQRAALNQIDAFSTVKQGQIYHAIKNDLGSLGIEPIEQDTRFLAQAISGCLAKVHEMKGLTHKELGSQQMLDSEQLEAFLRIIDHRKQQELVVPLRARRFHRNMSHRMKVREQKEMMVKRSLDTEATLAKSAALRPLPSTKGPSAHTSFWVAPSAAEIEKKQKEEKEKADQEAKAAKQKEPVDYHSLYVQESLLSESDLDQLYAQRL